MTLSLTLLAVAVATALACLGATGFRPPRTLRHLEQIFVVGIVVLGGGTLATRVLHHLDFFGIAHLLYLLAVVSLPLLLGGWFLLSVVRRERSRLFNVLGAVAAVTALCGVWATHIEPNWLELDEVATTGPVASPLRVGVLADLQTPNVGRHEWNAVNTLIAEAPDIIVIPGDFMQGPAEQVIANRSDFLELLVTMVEAVEVVAVVSGDSDDLEFLEQLSIESGALFIDNRIIEVTVAEQPVRLAGVEVHASSARLTTIADLREPSNAFTLLVSHRPDVVFDLPIGADVDLIASGHTHGGQVALPFFGPPVTFSDVPRSLAAGGLEFVDQHLVYVSSGVGLERFAAPQVRFNARPSVGIITVVPG